MCWVFNTVSLYFDVFSFLVLRPACLCLGEGLTVNTQDVPRAVDYPQAMCSTSAGGGFEVKTERYRYIEIYLEDFLTVFVYKGSRN